MRAAGSSPPTCLGFAGWRDLTGFSVLSAVGTRPPHDGPNRGKINHKITRIDELLPWNWAKADGRTRNVDAA
ncbi:hypothetical protein GAY33_23930 [Azospirillum brasilense]|nr:hypothetical protein [Azospirillum argentinense]